MDYVTEEDKKVEQLYRSCFNNRCFTSYYLDAVGATYVEQVEDFAKGMVQDHIQILEDTPDIDEGEKEALELCRSAIRGEVAFIHAWNKIYDRNGESHGTVIAMCFKSERPSLHALGRRILLELSEIQGKDEYLNFDT